MEFVKGYELEGGVVVLEGAEIKITTVQGEVLEGLLSSSSKKKIGIKIGTDLGIRIFEHNEITSINTM